MTEDINLICTTCPKGCTLVISREGETIVEVSAGCKRGKDYAHQELTDPRRMIATTVKIAGARHPLLPVYTAAPFPKPRITELMQALNGLQVHAPVKAGAVVLQDVLGTGIDILASRDMELNLVKIRNNKENLPCFIRGKLVHRQTILAGNILCLIP